MLTFLLISLYLLMAFALWCLAMFVKYRKIQNGETEPVSTGWDYKMLPVRFTILNDLVFEPLIALVPIVNIVWAGQHVWYLIGDSVCNFIRNVENAVNNKAKGN